MLRSLPIAWRITVLVLLGASLVLGGVSAYSYWAARDFLEQQKRAEIRATAQATANRIETVGRSVEKIVQGLAFSVDDTEPGRRRARLLLRHTVAGNEELFGSAIGFEPTVYGRLAPYVYQPSSIYVSPEEQGARPSGKLVETDLGRGGRAYEVGDWFQLPVQMRRAVWTEPYYDAGGGSIVMATYAVPVHLRKDPVPVSAVVTGDVSLYWLTRLLEGLDLGNTGYAFLISQTGTFIAHPDPGFIMNESVFSVAEARDDQHLRAIGRGMIAGESGYVAFNGVMSLAPDERSWLAYRPVPSTGWSLGIVFPDSEISADVVALSRIQWVIALLGITALLVVALLIARSITRPLRVLDAATQALAQGALDAPLPQARGRDEIAHLTASFGRMRDDLRQYIEELRATTAARERIESELRIAASIQMSLVPRTFPPYPRRHDMELNALLQPAREVGGDFYDFFLLDDDHLCLAIADVSGKGVPAALLMAVTRSFLRSFAREGDSPVQVLGWLNDELAADNEECMFVTMFLAVVDLRSGAVRYASAGHNRPFVSGGAGGVSQVPHVKGMALGARSGVVFEQGELTLAPGDVLYLYTDGVSEAMNARDEVYGEERLGEDLARLCAGSCDDILQALIVVLGEHTAGVEQWDDITMVAFRYLGPQTAMGDGAR
ncbi:MAG: SpoIIE family protein phosphatase [Actinomycetes bacterium]